jgi:hypothetical protein
VARTVLTKGLVFDGTGTPARLRWPLSRNCGRLVSPGARALGAGPAGGGWQTVGRAAGATPWGRDRSE